MNPRQRVRDIKKFGPPLFKKGEKVKSCIHDKVVIIANDPWCNGFTWMYELEDIEGSTGQDYLRKYSTPTSEEGTIVWHSIAEGHLPPKTNDSTNGNLILYSEPLDQFTRGFYRHDIDMWGHSTGNWQPTHFAYINYPE